MSSLELPDLPSKANVLIVGAGPTGLALAAELRRRGIEALIIDKMAEGANTSRAAVVHARTLEVLEPLDVVPTMLAEGFIVPVFRVRDRDRTLITINFQEIPSTYAFTLMCPQDRTEAILLARLKALGGEVIRPAAVTGVDLDASGARVQIAVGDATQTVVARWVIGCDGMHSQVREAAGIAFNGAAYKQGFILADVHMDWPLGRGEVSLFFAPAGLVVVAPLPKDRFRVVATVDDPPEVPSVPYVQALLDARGPKTSRAHIHDSIWSSRFKVHHRVAESPRNGRVLLCGDAAHVHSPAGGQGMNTGISLASALADVARGADEALLDTWAADRHKIAEGVVALTDRMTRIATLRSPARRALRNVAIGFAGHIPSIGRAIARNVAELRASA